MVDNLEKRFVTNVNEDVGKGDLDGPHHEYQIIFITSYSFKTIPTM